MKEINISKIIFEIKNWIYETVVLCTNYLKGFNLMTVFLVFLLLYILVIRKWELKKIIQFFISLILSFVLLVRFENFSFATFGEEGSSFAIGIARIVFIIIAALVFLYYATIKE